MTGVKVPGSKVFSITRMAEKPKASTDRQSAAELPRSTMHRNQCPEGKALIITGFPDCRLSFKP